MADTSKSNNERKVGATALGTEGGIKFFSLEKKDQKLKKIRNSKPENLIRRAGGLKARKDLK